MAAVVEQAPTLVTMAPTRREILQALKKRGEMGADELAGELGLTTSGVRQHMTGRQPTASSPIAPCVRDRAAPGTAIT
jgi:predicted transcriptional regulator